MVNHLNKGISRFLKYGTLISTTGLIGMVCVQIFARFALESAPSWTEEASRVFFIFAISFGAGLALKDHYFVALDVFYDKFPDKVKTLLNVGISLLNFALFTIFLIYSIFFIQLGSVETSPSLGISMAIPFISMVILGLFMAYFSFLQLLKAFKKL
ncbi:TRAP transporter small permease [Flexithrix dorotheae]|uniref:TRAP transporter small permease n=1 Tax=Flexithrix dorotheae TaxID=70993 RepID=UPI000376F87E|nr:TRAP transporter small permease [Flexithrix dorotheae]